MVSIDKKKISPPFVSRSKKEKEFLNWQLSSREIHFSVFTKLIELELSLFST
jgi:hypothetical protein